MNINQYFFKNILWVKKKNTVFYEAEVEGKQIYLRLNDFPEEPMYTLIVDKEKKDLDDLPSCWKLRLGN